MSGEIILTALFDKPAYPLLTHPQIGYLLLEVKPASAAQAPESLPLNLALVLDHSGSMAGEKLEQMKRAACQLVDRLTYNDWLSVIIFDEKAKAVVPAAPVAHPEAVTRVINVIEEQGGTHLSQGMALGLEQARAGLSPERVTRMVLLTDGQTWEDTRECEGLAAECARAGVGLTVVGLGKDEDWDPAFLSRLAERAGGEWEYVDSPDKLAAVFQRAVSDIQATAVTNALLTLRLTPDVSARTAWRVKPLISKLSPQTVAGHELQLHLGDIQHPRGQSVLAELILPPRMSGTYRLLQADVVYDVPGEGRRSREKAQIDVTVPYMADPVKTAKINEQVIALLERVVAHRLQTQALDEAAVGLNENATVRLRAAATRLLEMGESQMAKESLAQATALEQQGRLAPEANKNLRYITRRLTQKLPETEE